MDIDYFNESIINDLAWRKKEVSDLILIYEVDQKPVLLKSAILLIYSHWEGFIKDACKTYLSFVSSKKLELNKLSSNFHAIQLKGMVKDCYDSSNTLTLSNEISLINKLTSDTAKFILDAQITNPRNKKIINTKDNLNLKVFYSLMDIIGTHKHDSIQTKEQLINQQLLNTRNEIAHGGKDLILTIDDVKKVRDTIFEIMSFLSDDLQVYAEHEYFLSDNHKDKSIYTENRIAVANNKFSHENMVIP